MVWTMVVLMIVFLSATKTTGQEFEAIGNFKFEAYWPQYESGKQPCLILAGDFSATVSGCQSAVQYNLTNVVCHSKIFETDESGMVLTYDGTNFYEKLMFDTNLLENKEVIPVDKISSGPVPERTDNKLGTLWLAFASHCYFKNANPDLIYSPFMGSNRGGSVWTNDHRVRAIWSKLPGMPGLPGLVVHTSQFVCQDRHLEVVSNLVYTVSATTNFNGMTIPDAFECDFFMPPGTLVNSFSGKLERIQAGASAQSLIPTLPGRTLIIDERFINRAGNPVPEYMHRSATWPTMKEGETNLTKSKIPVERLGEPIQNATAQKWTQLVLAWLTLVPVILLVKKLKLIHQQK